MEEPAQFEEVDNPNELLPIQPERNMVKIPIQETHAHSSNFDQFSKLAEHSDIEIDSDSISNMSITENASNKNSRSSEIIHTLKKSRKIRKTTSKCTSL